MGKNAHNHQNVAYATVLPDGTMFAAAYPGPNTKALNVPSGYTSLKLDRVELSHNPAWEGDLIDVVHRSGNGSNKYITRVAAYDKNGRNEADRLFTTSPYLFGYERMEWYTTWQNLNLGIQTAIDDSGNGFVFFVKVADGKENWDSWLGGLALSSNSWNKTRGLHAIRFKNITNNGKISYDKLWADSSYVAPFERRPYAQIFSDLPRSITPWFGVGAKGNSDIYCVASLYDHPSRTYPETGDWEWGWWPPGYWFRWHGNGDWWKRHRQYFAVGVTKSSWSLVYWEDTNFNKTTCWQLGSTTSNLNTSIPFRVRHRYTRILCLPNNKIAFAEHAPIFNNESDYSTVIHSGTVNTTSFTNKLCTISNLGRPNSSENGKEGSLLDLAYKSDDPTLFLATCSRSLPNQIIIHATTVDGTSAYEVGSIASEALPKEIIIQVYGNYILIAWQENKKIKLGLTWIEKIGSQYKTIVPCCSFTIAESSYDITLRTFAISTNTNPKKLHVTFLEKGSSNATTQTYRYLYTNLATLLPEEL